MKQRQVAPEFRNPNERFLVEAGRIEGPEQERNYKVIQQFATLEEARDCVRDCQGYHFVDFMYVAPDGKVWNIELSPATPLYFNKPRKVQHEQLQYHLLHGEGR